MKRYFLVLLAIWAMFLLTGPPLAAQDETNYKISLGQREFTPEIQRIPDFSSVSKRFIMQFNEIPDEAALAKLKKEGITLQRYLGGNSWFAKKEIADVSAASVIADVGVRALVNIKRSMKLSPALGQYTKLDGKKSYHVRFFKDVDENKARQILANKGLVILKSIYKYSNTFEVTSEPDVLFNAADNEDILFIEPAVPAPKVHNSDAATRTNLDSVQNKSGYRNTIGTGVKVGVWDGGKIFDHNDLQGRITWVEDSIGTSGHATHVAGTIASSGINNSRAKGMAPNAHLYSGNFYGNPLEEMMDAVKKYGITLANNSWGTVSGWEYESDDDKSYWRWVGDWMFGYYPDILVDADDFIRENNTFLPLFSAGNDRDDSYFGSHYKDSDESTIYKDMHDPDGDFISTQTYANAKNILTVGATTKDDMLTSFSCKGPTLDGRLKPDIVAPGHYIYSTYNDGSYAYMSGTSMSCPVATGVAALITDYYKLRHGKSVRSDTLKNILIHSARDLGRPGPDYAYGHGMVDAELAARVVKKAVLGFDKLPGKFLKKDRDNNIASIIVEGEISNKKNNIYKFNLPMSGKELRVTLVWHDPGGDRLINNLDMTVKVKGMKKGKPWVLDPSNPASDARQSTNSLDNVESIIIKDVAEGAVTKIVVKGKSIPVGPQKYSLIVSVSDGNDAPVLKTDQSFIHYNVYTTGDKDSRDHVDTFHNTDPIYLKSEIQLTKNPSYGDYNASFSSTWVVTDPTGKEILKTYMSHVNDPNQTGRVWIFRAGPYEAMSTMPKGDYKVSVTFTTINGDSSTKENTFTIR